MSVFQQARIDAILGLVKTTFVCIILIVISLAIQQDAHELVLNPLEEIMEKVNNLANDPFQVIFFKDNTEQNPSDDSKKNPIKYETKVLDEAITKIATLLVLGFGEAGTYLLAQNLRQFGDLNAKVKGNKINAIFCLCDIRNFTDTTEALQERVMLFTNDIAKIVHGITIEYLGIPNKNVGDAFLILWKLPRHFKKNPSQIINNTADLALIAIQKILIKI